MDAHNEWTGITAEAHAACVHEIIDFFAAYSNLIADLAGKCFLVEREWLRFEPGPELDALRKDVLDIEVRISAMSKRKE